MTPEEKLNEKAFIVVRNLVHEVAEEVRKAVRITITSDKELPDRLLKHLESQHRYNNIIYHERVVDLGNDIYTHHLIIFKDFDLKN